MLRNKRWSRVILFTAVIYLAHCAAPAMNWGQQRDAWWATRYQRSKSLPSWEHVTHLRASMLSASLQANSVNVGLAWDYAAGLVPLVKEYRIYEIDRTPLSKTFDQRIQPGLIKTGGAPPTDTAPLILPLGFGARLVEVVPVDLQGAEGDPERFWVTVKLPKITNPRRVS